MRVEDVLADLIRIRTVNPPGGETEVAKYLKRLFDQYNIPNEIIEPRPGRGSFLAYLGEGERGLLYLSHTDVVAATEGWSFAPFSGEIKNDFVHGRGALDCKGLVAAEACAVIDIACKSRLKGRLIFVAAADEETLGPLGIKYLMENCREKIRADFAINEGAPAPVRMGGKTIHFLSVGEKGPVWTKLRARGTSAHGSLPMLGDNAIVKLAETIRRLSGYQPQIVLIPEVKKLIQAVAEFEGFNTEVNEENVDQIIQRVKDKNFAGYLHAITRMTVSTNVITGGVKINIVPAKCEADVDIRVLPGQDSEYVVKELSQIIGDAEMVIDQYTAPTFSTSDSESYRLITDTLKEFVGDAHVLPSITSGGTDSRLLREVGIPSYGVGMITLNLAPELRQSIHGKDEKIDIESLRLISNFLARLARKYLRG